MIKILIFEDNKDFTESLVDIIADAKDMMLLEKYDNCKDVVKKVQLHQPDVILMDIDMPVQNGLEGLRAIREANLNVHVLMLTVFDDNERVFQAICDGASGYILKKTPPEKILEYVREANSGGAPMTPSVAKQVLKLFSQPFQNKKDMVTLTAREHDVLTLLVRGFSYKMISSDIDISMDTVRTHIKNTYAKLHVNSKSEAVIKALQNKLV
jgi:DNA-binding NarL/FixJ family response regulator